MIDHIANVTEIGGIYTKQKAIMRFAQRQPKTMVFVVCKQKTHSCLFRCSQNMGITEVNEADRIGSEKYLKEMTEINEYSI
jgi:hypothetical protein